MSRFIVVQIGIHAGHKWPLSDKTLHAGYKARAVHHNRCEWRFCPFFDCEIRQEVEKALKNKDFGAALVKNCYICSLSHETLKQLIPMSVGIPCFEP
ncbi:MAG TPA: hypothetical protein DD827_04940 [Gammaproteobacteria bacterium]|nr:hypothetical protein [Gammaproteobacteria bacterium]